MEEKQAVLLRHSVRKYTDKNLDEQTINALNQKLAKINSESGLNIQLILNEDKAFSCRMAKYGNFSGVKNYFALVGKKGKDLYQKVGYYGEKLVLYAQTLGLNTCWVALTYKKIKEKVCVNKGEKLTMVISVGYGENQGKNRRSKNINQVSNVVHDSPAWFIDGVDCALKAPTAMNQQKFYFELKGNVVKLKAGKGFYTKTDSGIAKYHFELGAGKENFKWK